MLRNRAGQLLSVLMSASLILTTFGAVPATAVSTAPGQNLVVGLSSLPIPTIMNHRLSSNISLSVELSIQTFPDGADAVVLASAIHWADQLAASGLCGAVEGPLLLTEGSSLNATVRDEIDRLGASTVYVLGSTAAISSALTSELQSMGLITSRLAGDNRFSTARAISQTVWTESNAAFVVSGISPYGAALAAPEARAQGIPILLTMPTSLPYETSSELRRLNCANVIVIGDLSQVSNDVADELAQVCGPSSVSRIAGADWPNTSALVAQHFESVNGTPTAEYCVSEYEDEWAGLLGGVLAGTREGALLFGDRSEGLNAGTRSTLTLGRSEETLSRVAVLSSSQADYDGQMVAGSVEWSCLDTDTIAPWVETDLSSPYTDDATITIDARDGGSGVNHIGYRLDDETTVTVTGASTQVIADTPGEHEITFWATDTAGNTRNATSLPFTVISTQDPGPGSYNPIPIAGSNRYTTAIEASVKAYPHGASTVIIATGANFPDALGGAALAGVVDGPLLLTATDAIPEEVLAEVDRLEATSAYILGGTSAVSNEVERVLDAKLSGPVERNQGTNRYATANKVADEVIKLAGDDFSGKAFIATGANFPDALGASPLAASFGAPILLAPKNGTPYIPEDIEAAVILGGTAVVTDTTRNAVNAVLGSDNVVRIGGADRFDTAAQIADYGVAHGMHWDGVGIATGQAFPDALSGGAMLGSFDSVLLLTKPTSLVVQAEQRLSKNRGAIGDVYFIGGTGAVSQGVRDKVASILK